MLDTVIKPGETTAVHTHQWFASLYIISWSDFIRYDADGNVVVDSSTLGKTPAPAKALWSEPLAPHKLKNTGNEDLHVVSVEIKRLLKYPATWDSKNKLCVLMNISIRVLKKQKCRTV